MSAEQHRGRLELVRAHVRFENQHDLDGILQTFGAAVAYEDQAWLTLHAGAEGIESYYRDILSASADLRLDIHREHVCEDTIVLEVTISGTHTGPWHGLPPTGRRFEIPVCGIYTFDSHDRLAGERVYYDRATVFAQLGVFREPKGWFGKAAMVLNHPLTFASSVLRMLRKQG